jgi:hypothetical protein
MRNISVQLLTTQLTPNLTDDFIYRLCGREET